MIDSAKVTGTLLECLRSGGKIVKENLLEKKVITFKGELSLVTETDKRSEEIVVRTIQKNFPDHAILTEESPERGKSPYRWIIDPLDGTTNFAHSYPVSCVSIALEDHGKIAFGGVYDPFRDELFFAERGKGATLNDLPLVVSQIPILNQSLISTGFPYDCREYADEYIAVFRAFMMKTQGLRRTGAAAIDLCYVAAGRFDGFWEFKLNSWDIAAGALIVEEAGGKLSDFSGNTLDVTPPHQTEVTQTVASNGFIHEAMVEVLKPFK